MLMGSKSPLQFSRKELLHFARDLMLSNQVASNVQAKRNQSTSGITIPNTSSYGLAISNLFQSLHSIVQDQIQTGAMNVGVAIPLGTWSHDYGCSYGTIPD